MSFQLSVPPRLENNTGEARPTRGAGGGPAGKKRKSVTQQHRVGRVKGRASYSSSLREGGRRKNRRGSDGGAAALRKSRLSVEKCRVTRWAKNSPSTPDSRSSAVYLRAATSDIRQ